MSYRTLSVEAKAFKEEIAIFKLSPSASQNIFVIADSLIRTS